MYDGIAWGRPLLRAPASRPPVNIPPRKRRRVAYNEDEDDDEGFAALQNMEAGGSEAGAQLLLHGDLNDEDSEDDDDFASDEEQENGEETDEDDSNDRQLVLHADFENDDSVDEEEDLDSGDTNDNIRDKADESANGTESEEDQSLDAEMEDESSPEVSMEQDEEDNINEPALLEISDIATRVQIRKLQSAFPKSHLAVCKYVLQGVHGDIGEAYEVLARGFLAAKPKSAITEISKDQNQFSVPKTRSKAKATAQKQRSLESMQAEPDEIPNPLLEFYDQNGLPEGSIQSGRALSFMAEAVKG